ncbi:multidrug resistance-associated protein 1 [Ixodes scapularis]
MAVFGILWMDIFWVFLVTFAYYGCLIARIPILENLISDSSSSQLGALSGIFLATCVGEGLLSCYQLHLCARFGLRIRAILQAAVFQKFAMPFIGIICSPLIFYMLSVRVGVGPTVTCATWLLLAFLLTIPTTKIQNSLLRRVQEARDERLKLMTDLLSSVRLVKMYAWEEAYMNAVSVIREREMAPLFKANLLDGFLDSLYSASSSVMIVILFGALATLDPTRTLSPALSFSCVYMLSLTDIVTNSFSLTLKMIVMMSLSLQRVIEFCTVKEQENAPTYSRDHTLRKGEVLLEECSFAWTEGQGHHAKALLRGISMHVESGALVGVTGFVGSGKSSLLAAILGDMHRLEGSVRISGKIGYVPQVACIYNMAVRDNIVFGQEFDPSRYQRVLRACELLNDISTFPAGDLTEVGEKGETLSGGQKQRISLARAVYSHSDIYLLDDPFSALDSNVAAKVFKQVLGHDGLLKKKTRILVSNQGNILKHMNHLILMDRNTLTVYQNLEDLLQDERAPKTLSRGMAGRGQPGPADSETQTSLLEQEGSNGRLIKLESQTSSKGSWEVSRALLRFSGMCLPVALILFIASAIALAWQLLWIKQWTDANSRDTDDGSYNLSWLKGLIGLCFADVLFRCSGGALLAVSTRQLSRALHYDMLSHVLSSPVSFFDSTPRGRVLNRFSIDFDMIDVRYYVTLKTSIQNALLAFSKLSVVATQSPVVLGIGGVGAVIFVFGMHLIIRSTNRARFMEGALMSRVLQHVTETMDSLSSVRSYDMVERFCGYFCRLTDSSMLAYNAWMCCSRVSRALVGIVGFAIVLTTLVVAVVSTTNDASSVGLALTSSLSIPLIMMTLCTALFPSLQHLVAFERALEYTELPQEPVVDVQEQDQENKDLPEALSVLPVNQKWPSEGRLEFQDYATSYRPGVLRDVLKEVTFVVQPREKVGVVGRTGAGKSSLVLALLRVLRSSRGSIRIDGVDINTVPLRRLRNAVTVIPQDPSLVRGSLRDNLDATGSHNDEELWQALREAHLADFVASQRSNLLLEVGDGGSNLSVGQRQLVCLARALIRNTKVLLLDEATSQMDGDTDRLIQATLRESFARCTILAIAHRINTVLDYDKILVMGDGRVLEYGPVRQLLADEKSLFSEMAKKAGILPAEVVFEAIYSSPISKQ